MNTNTTPATGQARTKNRSAGLDQVLTRHWIDNPAPLVIAAEPPADPSTLSASARFADAVVAAAPNWVMLPIPPQSRDAAKRHVNALKRRGLDAVMRPHAENSRAWAIWATARAEAAVPERASERVTRERENAEREPAREARVTRETS